MIILLHQAANVAFPEGERWDGDGQDSHVSRGEETASTAAGRRRCAQAEIRNGSAGACLGVQRGLQGEEGGRTCRATARRGIHRLSCVHPGCQAVQGEGWGEFLL